MPTSLPKDDRNKLASAILKARVAVEEAVRKSLESLAVHEADPRQHMSPESREFRNFLRAKARQLGDKKNPHQGTHEIKHLIESIAYERWNQMLFARFLAENDLLHTEDGIPVTLEECDELASDEGERDGFALAVRYASRMLPQIFRPEDPTLRLEFDPYDQQQLKGILYSIPEPTFLATDALGWTYQYWQAEKKDAINESGNKIGADELPAVTQLFTENYMVLFLYHNTIGAWHAGKMLAENPRLAETAQSEDELRQAIRLQSQGGYDFDYLRFTREAREDDEEDAPTGHWRPAAGTFEGWPKTAKELKILDPCCGSGHFLIEGFELLVRLRMDEEGLGLEDTIRNVLTDNLHGLEIDPRCTQIAAFNLAMAAWKLAGKSASLPPMHIACSGLVVGSTKVEWTAFAGDNERLHAGMERLYDLFEQAPELGSLIDPKALGRDMFEAGFAELQPLLEQALARESDDVEETERAVVAQGMARAAKLLSGEYTLVITNVPFLGRASHSDVLRMYCDDQFPLANKDLATVFLARIHTFLAPNATASIVAPFNWTFLTTYEGFRKDFLAHSDLSFVASLGGGNEAFASGPGNIVNICLLCTERRKYDPFSSFFAIDMSASSNPQAKSDALVDHAMRQRLQSHQFENPDSRITLEPLGSDQLLAELATTTSGLKTGDMDRFARVFWEVGLFRGEWEFLQRTDRSTRPFGGRTGVILWQREQGELAAFAHDLKHLNHVVQNWKRGQDVWGKHGVGISAIGNVRTSIYLGDRFDSGVAVVVPTNSEHLAAVWSYLSSTEYEECLRRIDSKLAITTATLAKVPFDLEYWQKVADEKYPNGLPEPRSDDPTQWLFHGHPAKAESATMLQVAVARLLGYRWPAELDATMELSDKARALVGRCSELDDHTDDDGIACLPPVRGELPAAERIRKLLAVAFGDEWDERKLDQLLEQAGSPGKKLDDWLRDHFFEQHCKLFHHRPFVWHVWDGRKDGFSVLVNYHKLDNALLQKLIYSYLDEWIRVQKRDADNEVAGADLRLGAAQHLRDLLEQILKGEAPYDAFVRWKPLEKQPIGWNPDLNDGVRLNVRPFLTPELSGGKKGAGVLRWKPNVHWKKDRGKDVVSAPAPWHKLGLEYEGKEGDRINDHHLSLEEKQDAQEA